MDTPHWLTAAQVKVLHAESLRLFGGAPGLRDEGLMEGALARPQQRHAYVPDGTLFELAASLGIEIDEQIVKMASGLRDPYGIIVAARAAGARTEVPLQPRDVIRRLNNAQIFKLDQLRAAVQALKPGSPVTLQIQREGRLMYVSFTFD